jgi:dTDP-4-dehydrorhamnose reductase
MIWVAGNKGMLGRELTALLDGLKADNAAFEYAGTDREVDITDERALAGYAEGRGAGWIVDCAAYTAVDKAEDEPGACRRINVAGTAALANLAAATGAKLVYVSTDYVFDGKTNRPYKEDDRTNPANVYGASKRGGELEALARCGRSYILRTSWLYGKYGNNFVSAMLELMKKHRSLRVVNDQRGSPTWARDLAEVIVKLLKTEKDRSPPPYGIYHYTNKGNSSRYGFAREIYNQSRKLGLLDKACTIRSCGSGEYPAKARRPAYSCLDHSKIKTALNIEIPEWKVSLRKFLFANNYKL